MKLQSIEPIIEPPWGRERLWSYVQRLAVHHCVLVGDLIKEVIWPASGWPENKMRRIIGFDGIGFLDGAGPIARDWVAILQMLTGRNDLARLTFLPAAEVLRLDGAGRYQGARCIECVREMAEQLDFCYDPLCWALIDYTVCTDHTVLLADACASCRTEDLAIVRATSRLGCCGKCGVWMGADVFKAEPLADSSRYQVAISEALRDIGGILDDPRLAQVDGRRILEYAAKLSFDNNFAEMARTIGMPKNTLSVQLSRGIKPRIQTAAALSVVTGVPVKHLIFGSITGRRASIKVLREPVEQPAPAGKKTRRATMDFDAVEAELRRSLRGVRTPSLRKVAEKLGVSTRSLYVQFPELAQQVSARFLTSKRAKSNERTERNCKLMFSAIATLVLALEFPTTRRLSEILGPAACLEYREFYIETVKRYGLVGKGRAPQPVQLKALRLARRMLIENNLQSKGCPV